MLLCAKQHVSQADGMRLAAVEELVRSVTREVHVPNVRICAHAWPFLSVSEHFHLHVFDARTFHNPYRNLVNSKWFSVQLYPKQ